MTSLQDFPPISLDVVLEESKFGQFNEHSCQIMLNDRPRPFKLIESKGASRKNGIRLVLN